MRKIKLVFKLIGILLALALLALAAVLFTFDPNNYKDAITAQVEDRTGRQFTIAGDITLSIFPWIGIKVEDTTLGNAAGFSDKAFASVSQLDVKVKLLPLLRRELEVDKVRLHGLKASLEVDKTGKTNWSDLVQKEAAPAPSAEAPPKDDEKIALAAFAVNGVELVEATVEWSDDQNNVHTSLSNFNVTTTAIRFNQPVDVKFNTTVKHNEPPLDAVVDLDTEVTFNESFTRIAANNTSLKVETNAPELFKQKQTIQLSSDIDVDLDKQQATVSNTKLTALGFDVSTDLVVNKLASEPVASGSIKSSVFNAREVAELLNVSIPPMANPDSLGQVAFASSVLASGGQIKLDDILVDIDKSKLTGWLHVPDMKKPVVRYKLHMTAIDADAYLPTTSAPVAGGVATPASSVPVDQPAETDAEIALPVELLRKLDMQGDLIMDSVTINQQPIINIKVKTQAKSGIVRVDPANMSLLDGQMNASMMLNVNPAEPAYAIALKASRLNAGPVVDPLLVGVFGEHDVKLEGSANVLVDINTSGNRVSALKQAAKGNIKFDMGKTLLQGVDIEYYVRNIVADYLAGKGMQVSPEWRGQFDPKSKTAFYRIRASAIVANGELTNRDFLLDSKRMRVTGEGVVNIMRNDMNYNALVDIAPSRTKTVAEKLLDQPLKIHIHGPFEQLAYDVDKKQLKKALGNLLEAEAKAKAKKEIEEEKEKLRQKARKEEEEFKQRMQDKLKDKLKGLF